MAWTVEQPVVPGHATPEQYVKEITIANERIVHQPALDGLRYPSLPMIENSTPGGAISQKDETGRFTT